VDELQSRLARLGLDSLAAYGFALAGGYALQAHGLVERLSEDVDLFTDRWDPGDFTKAVDSVAVASKTAAIFSRGEARDYLDLAGILASARHDREELMTLAARVDGGFDRQSFAQALAGVDRFPDQEYGRYGLTARSKMTYIPEGPGLPPDLLTSQLSHPYRSMRKMGELDAG
jgi:hypothetical protein